MPTVVWEQLKADVVVVVQIVVRGQRKKVVVELALVHVKGHVIILLMVQLVRDVGVRVLQHVKIHQPQILVRAVLQAVIQIVVQLVEQDVIICVLIHVRMIVVEVVKYHAWEVVRNTALFLVKGLVRILVVYQNHRILKFGMFL